jgi:universal stress protein E
MRSIRRILVSIKDPVNGPTPAVKKAAQLARLAGARLELFHAITTPIYLDGCVYSDWSPTHAKRDAVRRRTEELERIAQSFSPRGRQKPLSISVHATWDYPSYAAIVRRAQTTQADLVVADRHAGRHFARTVMHFADWELLRLCPAAVLLVGQRSEYRRPAVLTAVDPAHQWEKPARLDDRILSLGAMLSTILHGSLHAVHAYEAIPLGIYPNEIVDPKLYQEVADRRRTTAAVQFKRAMRGTGIRPSRQYLVDAPAALAIAKVAKDIHADIAVLGAVSRSGLNRLIIGSTAEMLLDRLSCDLLIVKPARFRTRVARAQAGARIVPALPALM